MPYSSETIELMRIDVFPFLIGNFSQSMGANRIMTEDLVLRTARYWSIFQSKNEPEIGPGGKGQAAG